jgi:ketosteroid isomerase-like protein
MQNAEYEFPRIYLLRGWVNSVGCLQNSLGMDCVSTMEVLVQMSAVEEVEELLQRYKLATAEFVRGNPEPYKALFSHQQDVTLANPFFPVVRGWGEVSMALERTASRLRDGEFLDSEIVSKYVTDELAYVVQLAHERAKVGGNDELSPIDLRNTMILRPEGGKWKIVHLHGDPITTPQPAESVIQK